MHPPNEPARPEHSDDGVGRSGARFPSAKRREAFEAEPDPQPPESQLPESQPPEPDERLPGGSGARFPSAKALERIERAERKAAEKQAAKQAKKQHRRTADTDKADRSRVGRAGARFPSAAALERYEEESPAPPDPPSAEALPPAPTEPPRTPSAGPSRSTPAETDPDAEPYDPLEENRLRVRPYVITRGHTEVRGDLAIEAMVTVNPGGPWARERGNTDYQAVRRICSEPRSVAEVAALMSVPLGAARVLLSDLAGADMVRIHAESVSGDERPGYALMQRVLAGLHRL